MPTRRLPAQPSLAHLKYQAKKLLKLHLERELQALQRIREFYPRLRGRSDDEISAAALKLADAQLTIAREYGFPSWTKLKGFVESQDTHVLDLPAHERIDDPEFRRAVDFMDAGDVGGLREQLLLHPELINKRLTLLGGNYFVHPTLLEFIAENPTRTGTLPNNAADVARVILDAGARDDREALDSALELVASSSVTRQSGLRNELIDVLCQYGANPDAAIRSPLLYGEFDAVERLLQRGAQLTLIAAAALGRTDDVFRLAKTATADDRKLALALSAQHGRTEVVRVLLNAGVDPNGFTPGGHSHATALHQAALAGHDEIVRKLLAAGARATVGDVLFGATPAGWAQHNGHEDLARFLQDYELKPQR